MTVPGPAGSPRADFRGRVNVSLRRDPVRLTFSRATWASAWYLLGYLFTGWGLFAVAPTILIAGGLLSVTLAGLPVLIAAAAMISGCANFERARLRVMGESVQGAYRAFTGHGLMKRLRVRWTDPAIWRDVAYLFGMLAPLMALDFAVLTVWLTFLAGVTLPAWYRYPDQTWAFGVSDGNGAGAGSAHGVQAGYFPNGPHGHGSWGIYVDTLPKALAVAAVCLILFMLFNYVLVATARLHVAIARSLLRPPGDPMREAKEVLASPGPLHRFTGSGDGDPVPPAAPGPPSAGRSRTGT